MNTLKKDDQSPIREILSQENCLMCQNNGDCYCGVLHRPLKLEEVTRKPCLKEREEDSFEPVFSSYEIEIIEATVNREQTKLQAVASIDLGQIEVR